MKKLLSENLTISGGMWDQINRLWNSDKELKQSLLKQLNDGIKKELPFSYKHAGYAEMDYFPDPWIEVVGKLKTVTITSIERAEGDWNVAKGEFTGFVDSNIESGGWNIYGDLEFMFKVIDGKLIITLTDLTASSSTYLNAVFAKLYFKNNYVKLWVNTILWSGFAGTWNTGIEAAAKAELKNKEINIQPFIEELKARKIT
tara:strand:+ start:12725 stop:13327 length:603 start_codon:yes stop_codon:yes gene_type:complete